MKPKNQTKRLVPRIWTMIAFCGGVMGVFILQLINFQLVNGEEYLQKAQSTQTYQFNVSAARGDIVDRYGRSTLPITTTEPFEFTVDSTADSSEDSTLARQQKRLAQLKTDFDKQSYATAEEVLDSMVEKYELEEYSPQWQRTLAGIRYQMQLEGFGERNNFTFADEVSMKTVSIIKERSLTLTGVEIVETSTRVYPDGTILPHVLGTVGPIYAEDWEKDKAEMKEKGYEMDDLIGHGGLEEALEDALRGEDGVKMVEYSKDGTIHRSWMQEQRASAYVKILSN